MQILKTITALSPLWIGNLFALALISAVLLRRSIGGIPRELVDSARIDGCGFWRTAWHVMLPRLRPTLGLIAIFILLAALNDLTEPWLAEARGLFSLHPLAPLLAILAASLLLTPLVISALFCAGSYFSKKPPLQS